MISNLDEDSYDVTNNNVKELDKLDNARTVASATVWKLQYNYPD